MYCCDIPYRHLLSIYRQEKVNKSSLLKGTRKFNSDILLSIYQREESQIDVNSLVVVRNKMQTAKEEGNGKIDAGHVLQQLQCTN